MTLRKSLFAAGLVVLALCLAAGYAIAGQWIGTAAALMTGPAWLLARKYPASGLPLGCLLVSIGLAVVGRLTGAPPVLMIGGAGIALAVWDLLVLDVALGGASSAEQTRAYEASHVRSLGLALGGGLAGALLGRWLQLQIPFFITALLIALAVFGLDRAWGYVKKTA
jgi:hypothetical protein